MKRCPQCGRDYNDDSMSFCLDDGAELLFGPGGGSSTNDEPATAILPVQGAAAGGLSEPRDETEGATAILPSAVVAGGSDPRRSFDKRLILAPIVIALIGLAGFFGYRYITPAKQINSIAVMPFVNESGNADVEYLSDGITESLIGSLSQIAQLNVKARSSVFRYKGKDADAKTIGRELNVQAVLNGRVVQRGQDLTLYIELVDTATENSLWKQSYNKTMTNLVALQTDVARDVAENLKIRLSGADVQKLAIVHSASPEAYQLYLQGRYYMQRSKRLDSQAAISYFEQAVAIDPAYALAYVGVSDAYRILSLGGEMPSSEVSPKAKNAALKAIAIDDGLAEAHTALGSMFFFFDWNWSDAETQFKRAIELDPKSADSHQAYAFLLSCTGRHAESLAEIAIAKELDPLNLRTNALEGQYLIHAGQVDKALITLEKTTELDANFWLAHLFAASAYIEKGMFAQAEREALKAKELTDASTHPQGFLGYTLAKAGRQRDAQLVLDDLLKLSAKRHVSPYSIALVYNGLGDSEKTFQWLENGYKERAALMVFVKVEPKWNNLRDDPRFEDLLKRMNLLK